MMDEELLEGDPILSRARKAVTSTLRALLTPTLDADSLAFSVGEEQAGPSTGTMSVNTVGPLCFIYSPNLSLGGMTI
jgi:hypothetical protein